MTTHGTAGGPTVAGQLAEFFVDVKADALPPLAYERARMAIASTVASAAMGATIDSSRIFREMAYDRGGTPEASIWFDTGAKLPIVDAARANAVASDAAASDDSDLRQIAHTGTTVTSTALAVAERTGASGRETLAAMIVGYEAAGRICEVVRSSEMGIHTGVITIFGAAVTAGRLLHLDHAQMTKAIALAATSIGGISAASNTSLAREYDAGLAVTLGMTAALAGQKRFAAEEAVLEMPRGFFEVYHAVNTESVLADLGGSWDIATNMAIKLIPGGHPSHGAVRAAEEAARMANAKPDDIEAIIVRAPTYRPLLHPTDLVGVAHSVTYMVACAVADGAYTWGHASEEKIHDPVIWALQEKIQGGDAPANAAQLAVNRGGCVTIRTKSGQEFTATVEAPRGSAPTGIEWADVDEKYRTLAPLAVRADKLEDSLRAIHDFEAAPDVNALIALLR